jgi:hypothetical protein
MWEPLLGLYIFLPFLRLGKVEEGALYTNVVVGLWAELQVQGEGNAKLVDAIVRAEHEFRNVFVNRIGAVRRMRKSIAVHRMLVLGTDFSEC